MNETPPEVASQEAPCWLCQSVNAIRGKCAYHRLEPILGHVRSVLVDLESAQQNRNEWEQRALKAEAALASLEPSVEVVALVKIVRKELEDGGVIIFDNEIQIALEPFKEVK